MRAAAGTAGLLPLLLLMVMLTPLLLGMQDAVNDFIDVPGAVKGAMKSSQAARSMQALQQGEKR